MVHTATAAVLQASLLGAKAQLDPGPHETGNGLDSIDATLGVPHSLSDALDALAADRDLVEAVGADLVSQHLSVKRAEWERYLAATTDWEMREYLAFL